MFKLEKCRAQMEQGNRRGRWLAPGGALIGGVTLACVLAVSTGLKPRDLYEWWQRPGKAVVKPRPPVVLAPRTVQNVHHEDPKARFGTDSSASTVPLSFHLVRAMPGLSSRSGKAQIGVDVSHPQTYLAGAILENGARLDEIYRDHVVLVKGAHHTSLYITTTGASTVATKPDALTLTGGPTPVVGSPHLSLEPVTDYLRVVPLYRDNIVAGFQVYPGVRTAPFTKWGLRPGDVMIDLDGQPLSDPDQVMASLRGLIDGEALTATVEREGASLSITLNGADIQQLRTASNAPLPPPNPATP